MSQADFTVPVAAGESQWLMIVLLVFMVLIGLNVFYVLRRAFCRSVIFVLCTAKVRKKNSLVYHVEFDDPASSGNVISLGGSCNRIYGKPRRSLIMFLVPAIFVESLFARKIPSPDLADDYSRDFQGFCVSRSVFSDKVTVEFFRKKDKGQKDEINGWGTGTEDSLANDFEAKFTLKPGVSYPVPWGPDKDGKQKVLTLQQIN